MKTIAAVLTELGAPLEIVELDIPGLQSGQALVEISCSGVCHTQVLECRGRRGQDRFLPHCLGHEAGGRVLEIGPGVSKVKPGDDVIMSWIKGHGINVSGTQYDWKGRSVNAGSITTFSRHAVVSENRLTPMHRDLSMEQAALIGCAVATGAGAVFNTAAAKAGDSLAVFGLGGVGTCALLAAQIAGCTPVIAIDVNPAKLKHAQMLGATHMLDATKVDPREAINQIVPGGVDFSIEATGRPEAMLAALACVRPQGGSAVLIGNAVFGDKLQLDPGQFNQGKRILGTWGGDTKPDVDFPRLSRLIVSGKLDLSSMLSNCYALADINNAINDLEAGRVVRPIIDMRL